MSRLATDRPVIGAVGVSEGVGEVTVGTAGKGSLNNEEQEAPAESMTP